jgi:hypothetical protein
MALCDGGNRKVNGLQAVTERVLFCAVDYNVHFSLCPVASKLLAHTGAVRM